MADIETSDDFVPSTPPRLKHSGHPSCRISSIAIPGRKYKNTNPSSSRSALLNSNLFARKRDGYPSAGAGTDSTGHVAHPSDEIEIESVVRSPPKKHKSKKHRHRPSDGDRIDENGLKQTGDLSRGKGRRLPDEDETDFCHRGPRPRCPEDPGSEQGTSLDAKKSPRKCVTGASSSEFFLGRRKKEEPILFPDNPSCSYRYEDSPSRSPRFWEAPVIPVVGTDDESQPSSTRRRGSENDCRILGPNDPFPTTTSEVSDDRLRPRKRTRSGHRDRTSGRSRQQVLLSDEERPLSPHRRKHKRTSHRGDQERPHRRQTRLDAFTVERRSNRRTTRGQSSDPKVTTTSVVSDDNTDNDIIDVTSVSPQARAVVIDTDPAFDLTVPGSSRGRRVRPRTLTPARALQLQVDEVIARRLQEEFDAEEAAAFAQLSQNYQMSTSSNSFRHEQFYTTGHTMSPVNFLNGILVTLQHDLGDLTDLPEVGHTASRNTRTRASRGRSRRGRGQASTSHPRMGPYMFQNGDESFNSNDYEFLWQLSNSMGSAVPEGLTKHEIALLPTVTYASPESADNKSVIANSDSCQVCLSDYENGEKLRRLPCFHMFHAPCIDSWLKTNASCPICRVKVTFND